MIYGRQNKSSGTSRSMSGVCCGDDGHLEDALVGRVAGAHFFRLRTKAGYWVRHSSHFNFSRAARPAVQTRCRQLLPLSVTKANERLPTWSTQPCIPVGSLNCIQNWLQEHCECYLCRVAGNTVITHGVCFSVVMRHVGAKCYALFSLLYLKAQIGTSHVLSNPGISCVPLPQT